MQKYMEKCFELAKKGEGKVSPNPLVGCVVLDKNGKKIAEGFHAKYGENHAERNALLKVENAQDGTLIVNLEPCTHQGKTPPCTDLIIEKGIKKVVVAMRDPNPIVNGKGIEKLKNAGIEVVEGVLEDEAKELNEVFVKNQTEKKLFVTLKTATTLDGKIATKTGSSKWITGEKARKYGKKLRQKYDAILTTSKTVMVDNPEMKHSKKIVLDRILKTDFDAQIYKQGDIFVAHSENITSPEINGINFIPTPLKNGELDLNKLFEELFNRGIMSVFVEAGGTLAGDIVKEDLADKIYHFVAPKIIGDDAAKSCFTGGNVFDINEAKTFKTQSVERFGEDILITYTR